VTAYDASPEEIADALGDSDLPAGV